MRFYRRRSKSGIPKPDGLYNLIVFCGSLIKVTKLYVIANLVALINMVLLSIFNTPKLFYICSALNGFSLGKWFLLPSVQPKLRSESVIKR